MLPKRTDTPEPPANPDSTRAPVPDTARTIGGWMIALLWTIALGAAAYGAQGWLDRRAESRQGITLTDDRGGQFLTLRSDRYGQYMVKGSANGQPIFLLVDTGASGISIPAAMASQLNLTRGRPFQVSTANGITTVYATTLDSLAIGPLVRRDVKAHINPSMGGDTALLGMNFLRHYELLQRNGELTIRNP